MNPVDSLLESELDSLLNSVDPAVLVSAFLFLNPRLSVASIAKPYFGITPAALARALRRQSDFLREDWKSPALRILAEDNFEDYQRKVTQIARANQHIGIKQYRSSLQAFAIDYLKARGMDPEPFNTQSLDFRSFWMKDRQKKAAWVFLIPDNLADSNGCCKSFKDYTKEYLEFAANSVTLAIFANQYALSARNIDLDGLPQPEIFPNYQQTVILQMTDDYSRLLGEYLLYKENTLVEKEHNHE